MTKIRNPHPSLVDGPSKLLGMMRELDTIWGHARVGLCLTDAYLKGISRSAREIAVNTGLHKDTVLKHLKQLETANRAVSVKDGRSVLYQANPDWAARSIEKMVSLTDWIVNNIENQEENAP